ncbi:hypothetical protein L573_0182 [Bordetella holmesii H620]|nr:hypothetical protein L573_0182 [Bordetella holmesii H620]
MGMNAHREQTAQGQQGRTATDGGTFHQGLAPFFVAVTGSDPYERAGRGGNRIVCVAAAHLGIRDS